MGLGAVTPECELNESTADGVNVGARCGKRVVSGPAKKSVLHHPLFLQGGPRPSSPPSTTAYFPAAVCMA